MAKEKKVEQITDMEVDFTQWFTDVCKKAQLIDYSSIKGIFVYRPYGYASGRTSSIFWTGSLRRWAWRMSICPC